MRISDWSSDVCSSDLRSQADQKWRLGVIEPSSSCIRNALPVSILVTLPGSHDIADPRKDSALRRALVTRHICTEFNHTERSSCGERTSPYLERSVVHE